MTKSRLQDEANTGDIIQDHPFIAKNPDRGYWSLCGHVGEGGKFCNLALAAHARTNVPNEPTAKRAEVEDPAELRTEEPMLGDNPIQTEALPEFNGNGRAS